MGRRTTGRLLAGGGLVLVGAAAVALPPAPALADGTIDQVTVTGVDLAEPMEVRAEEQPERFTALRQEVGWLVGRAPTADEPDPDTLGPQYTLVLHVEGEPRHRFHVYPLAEGGSRVFRPAEQPADRTVKDGWFFGRLSMRETLREAGLPLTGDPVPPGGGTGGESGGGGGQPVPGASPEPDSHVLGFLDEWRTGMVLTVAVVMVIATGLGGVAFLIRRTV